MTATKGLRISKPEQPPVALPQAEIMGEGDYQLRQVFEFQQAPYQREQEKYRARNIAENYDRRKLQVLYGSERGGHLWCVDGGHRLEALKILGKHDAWVPTWVYQGLSYEEEARIYRETQEPGSRKALTTGERFVARIEEKDQTAIQIRELILRVGIPLDLHMRIANAKALRSIATFERLYRLQGPQVAESTLRVLMGAWGEGEANNAYHQYLIKGTGLLLARYHNRVDESRLIDALGEHTPRQVIYRAGQLSESINSGMGTAIARAEVAIYNNAGRGGRLPDWGVDVPYRAQGETILTTTEILDTAGRA